MHLSSFNSILACSINPLSSRARGAHPKRTTLLPFPLSLCLSLQARVSFSLSQISRYLHVSSIPNRSFVNCASEEVGGRCDIIIIVQIVNEMVDSTWRIADTRRYALNPQLGTGVKIPHLIAIYRFSSHLMNLFLSFLNVNMDFFGDDVYVFLEVLYNRGTRIDVHVFSVFWRDSGF